MKGLVVAFLLLATVFAKHEQYLGWKSYFVAPKTGDHLKVLADLRVTYDLDFISNPSVSHEGVVIVDPQLDDIFIRTLDEAGIGYRIHSADIKKTLDAEDEEIEQWSRTLARNGERNLPYNNYQRVAAIDNYLSDIARRYPNRATLVSPAVTYEGRRINYLRISNTNFADPRKPVIIIDGGIHAREWISPPTVTWAIHKLVEDVTEPDLLNNFDWILLPVLNPDGYEFSHTNTRMWRKNRSIVPGQTSAFCNRGVDGNRNFDFFWNTVGTSSNPCAETFAGSSAFSEIETRALRDIVQQHLHRTALYITMHSFGSMILYGWGHDGSLPSNALSLHTVGVAMAQAIDRNNTISYFPNYVVGNSVLTIGYAAAGAAEDYALSLGVPFSYTFELPGLIFGFQLPPRYIQQVCTETWAGIVAGARTVRTLYQGPIRH